jgi:hypothetical protein
VENTVKSVGNPSEQPVIFAPDWSAFPCQCGCGQAEPSARLKDFAEKLCRHIRGSIIITSGRRCAAHNEKVSGAKFSYHLSGDAIDCKIKSMDPLTLGFAALKVGFTGIIVHKTFVHLDVRKRGYQEWNVHLFDEDNKQEAEIEG